MALVLHLDATTATGGRLVSVDPGVGERQLRSAIDQHAPAPAATPPVSRSPEIDTVAPPVIRKTRRRLPVLPFALTVSCVAPGPSIETEADSGGSAEVSVISPPGKLFGRRMTATPSAAADLAPADADAGGAGAAEFTAMMASRSEQ